MPQKILSATAKKIVVASASAIVIVLVVLLIVRHFLSPIDGSARTQFLRFVPVDATAVCFVDLDELRASPFLAALYAWAPQPFPDAEYAQFVRDTGFDYERDLQKVFVALSNHGEDSSALILAEGKFDRKKLAAYLGRYVAPVQQGSLQVYALPAEMHDKPLSVALLSDRRVAITNSANLFALLSSSVQQRGQADWQMRFDRLAGSPAFAVIRQDAALQSAVGAVAPGGFRSPQLAALLGQLQWISIAGKPDNELLRVVADGETTSETVSQQLRDFLAGIQVLAQDGLNDPKLRQQMRPEEREAYLELLQSADVQRLDRGQTKSVRLVLNITPQFLAVAKTGELGLQPSPESDAAKSSTKRQAAKGTKPSAKK